MSGRSIELIDNDIVHHLSFELPITFVNAETYITESYASLIDMTCSLIQLWPGSSESPPMCDYK
jgi:hypothetical protein